LTQELFIPIHVGADTSNRITLPRHFSDRIIWLQGMEPIRAWLLLITIGRYRLLSDEQVQNDPLLEPVRLLVLEGKSTAEVAPTFAEDTKRAAIVARLLPAMVAPPPPGWRVSFPRAFDVFAPLDCDRKAFSMILSLEGYWEIWYTDVLRGAAALPLQK
jgi:hypothetical protein